jgi:type II secretory pathway pseudopilin PulG
MVVITILSVLSAITYPAVRAIMDRVHRAKAAHNLRTIALAHAQFISDFGRAITFTDVRNISGDNTNNVNAFAAVLAEYGYIEDVSVWAWDFDYKVRDYKRSNPSNFPTEIYDPSTQNVHPKFKGSVFPISVVCCVVQCPNFDYKTLLKGKHVAAYSRGLKNDGHWRESSGDQNGSVFGTKGGLIAYFNGSVEWFDRINSRGWAYYGNTDSYATAICNSIPNNHRSMGTAEYTDSNFLSWTGANVCHNN